MELFLEMIHNHTESHLNYSLSHPVEFRIRHRFILKFSVQIHRLDLYVGMCVSVLHRKALI